MNDEKRYERIDGRDEYLLVTDYGTDDEKIVSAGCWLAVWLEMIRREDQRGMAIIEDTRVPA